MVDPQPTLPLASHLAALRQSFRRVERLVERVSAEADAHAAAAAAARARLAACTTNYSTSRRKADAARRDAALVEAVTAARARLDAPTDGRGPLTPICHALESLEQVAPRVLLTVGYVDGGSGGEGVGKDSSSGGGPSQRSSPPLDALREACGALRSRLASAWSAWLTGPTGAAMLESARALVLAPPAHLSAGVDGLDAERATAAEAEELLALVRRADALLVAGAAAARCSEEEEGPAAGREGAEAAVEAACSRARSHLQHSLRVASRLAGQAAREASDADAAAAALAEAAHAAGSSMRAAESLFRCLPLTAHRECGAAAAAGETADGEGAAALRPLWEAASALLVLLRRAEGGAARPTELRAAAEAAREMYEELLGSTEALVAAAAGGGKLSRRLLSKASEAIEQGEEAASLIAAGGEE